ncbi:MAG: hypothetical protein SO188_05940, partial [Prevotella sp.]|nr:hypothetical protein [Prevotella sp.]
SNVLSNMYSNGFLFDGMECGSMEGFLQSLKRKELDKQRQICSMKGGNARKMSVTSWQTDQIVWWKGQAIDRQSEEYQQLIRRAYQAMFEQSERFRAALMQTRGITLVHTSGEPSSYKTILTPLEFCGILTDLRDHYDLRDKTKELSEQREQSRACSGYAESREKKVEDQLEEKSVRRKKRVFVDMDNVLVDFQSGLDLQSDEIKKEYEGRLDEIPGLFAEMKPMPGAIEAMHTLQEHFDLYILSTAPWKNPSAWSDKVKWVTRYLDDVFHKRMVITHCKNLCKGDYLIDDRGKNGTSEFEGKWIQFGNNEFPDWESVVNYLLRQELC